jgi:hypothetical protein
LLFLLLSLRRTTGFLLRLALRSLILICLLVCLGTFLAALTVSAAAALGVGNVAGTDKHRETKRSGRCEALVVNFHFLTPSDVASYEGRVATWQVAFHQKDASGRDVLECTSDDMGHVLT